MATSQIFHLTFHAMNWNAPVEDGKGIQIKKYVKFHSHNSRYRDADRLNAKIYRPVLCAVWFEFPNKKRQL